MTKYKFRGSINPRSYQLSHKIDWSLITGEKDGKLYELHCKIDIEKSEITIDSKTDANFSLYDHRDAVVSFLGHQLSAHGFQNGLWLEAEINAVYDYDAKKWLTIDPIHPALEKIQDDLSTQKEFDITQILDQKKYIALRYALRDAQLAIKYLDDTGTFCFRAIESIREFFVDQDTDNPADSKNSWIRMNRSLNLSREYTGDISKFALGPRHGSPTLTSRENKMDIVKRTWIVIDRFMIFVNQKETPLNDREYPKL